MRSSFVTAVVISLLVLVFTATTAEAGQFQVQPTLVDLAGKHRTGSVVVTNHSTTATRFQVKATRWSQDEAGEMTLTPTDEIVVYPSLFTLEPGANRSIRIAGTVAPGALELSYRIFIEELPSLQTDPQAGARVRVLTRMGIPVFLAPLQVTTVGAVEAAVVGGQLALQLHNRGSLHIRTNAIRVTGSHTVDSTDVVDFDRSQAGWYLLAGDTRRYLLSLSPAECAAIQHVAVEVTTDAGVWTTTATVSPAACREIH